jgi:hypothetical protein
MSKRSDAKAQARQAEKLVEARAGAHRTAVATAIGRPEPAVRARLKFEYTNAGLELDDVYEAAIAELVAGRPPAPVK